MLFVNLGCGKVYHYSWINIDLVQHGSDVIPCDLRYGIPMKTDSVDGVYHSHLLEHFSRREGQIFIKECWRVLKPGGIIRIVVPDLERIARWYLKLLDLAQNGDLEAQARYDWIMLEMYDQAVRNHPGGEIEELWKSGQLAVEDFIVQRCGCEYINSLSDARDAFDNTSISSTEYNLSGFTGADLKRIAKFRLSGEPHLWMYDRYALKHLFQKIGFGNIQQFRADQSNFPEFNQYCLDVLENGGVRKPDSLFMEALKGESNEFHGIDPNRATPASSVYQSNHQNNVRVLIAAIRKANSHNKNLIAEIKKRDQRLNDQKTELINEINKLGKQRSEYWQYYRDAVQEIHKRDGQLARLRQAQEKATAQLKQQKEELAQVKAINRRALPVLPLVSIVTPVLNGAKWIEACILSVMQQDYPKIEHIIIEGGSSDRTLAICEKYSHLVIHSKPDRGQSHAINKGFAMAQGDILAWLCADDLYEPGAVTAAVKTILTGHDVVMGYSRFIDAQGNFITDHPANAHPWYDHAMLIRFWKYNPISQPAVFWNRKIWDMCGPVIESQFFAMDYDLWLRMSRITYFERVEAYIARYRIHPEAKCFADNEGSKTELLDVSRKFWPSRWRPGFWKLYFSYRFSNHVITKHYSDGVRLLDKVCIHLDNAERLKALGAFCNAHWRHWTTPLAPNYQSVALRIIKEGLGLPRIGCKGETLWHILKFRVILRGNKRQ